MSIEQTIKEKLGELGNSAYFAPSINPKKLNNAVTYIAVGIDPSFIIAIIDITLFGSAKEGYVFTYDTMYYKDFTIDSISIPYDQIGRAEYKVNKKTDKKGKTVTEYYIHVYDKNNKIILDKFTSSFLYDKLTELLNAIVSEPSKDSDKTQTMEEMIKCGDEASKAWDSKKALFYYNKALEINNTSSIIYCKRASAYGGLIMDSIKSHQDQVNFFSKGILDLNEAIKYAKGDEEMSYCLKQKGSFLMNYACYSEDEDKYLNEAIKNLSKSIKLRSVDYEAFYSRALVFLELCEYEKASADLIKTLELDTMNEESDSYYFIECIKELINSDMFKEASNVFNKYWEKYINDDDQILSRNSDWEEIISVLSEKGYKGNYETYMARKEAIRKAFADSKANSDQTVPDKEEKDTGLLGGIVNIVKKGVNSYKGAIEKEKEKMEDWTDDRLASIAQTKQALPAGMAAMQILKERGYTSSQIARM